jgi:DNA-binding transcriptional ArsR family regulator
LTDPSALKGLTHPLRRALYDRLVHFGPATVSALADQVESDPGQVSYHLRELGKRGFIEETPEYARDRRERWWRAVPGSLSWSTTSFEDPADRAVADTVYQQTVADQFERLQRFNRERDSWDPEWTRAATNSNSHLRLTPDELKALSEELNDVLRRWSEIGRRDRPARPGEQPDDGRAQVFLFFHGFPERP